MKIKLIGVDLAKNVFQLHGVDHTEQVVLRRRLKREDCLRCCYKRSKRDVREVWKRVRVPTTGDDC